MLNLGLIGKINSIEKQIEKLSNYPDIRILGKSSVGINTKTSDSRFSIPEYNRVELIERADAIFIEGSSLVPYTLIKDSIKRRKHIYFEEYPDFDEEQCNELIKLIDEAGTVVQIKNPLYFNPLNQYVIKNTTLPFYLNIDRNISSSEPDNKIFKDIILMGLKMGLDIPRRTKATCINLTDTTSVFQNLRLEFSDSSIFELNITYSDDNDKFIIKVISKNNIFNLNLETNHITAGSVPVNSKKINSIKEYESFFKTVIKKQQPLTGIRDYLTTIKVVEEIISKINLATI